jgi:hypothetical protein
MTKLDEMWDAFADYQSIATHDRHGDTWSDMCRLRTIEACRAAEYVAADAAKYAVAKYAASKYAAANAVARAVAAAAAAAASKYAAAKYAADAAKYADYAEIMAQEAIDFINKAIELADQWQNFCSILFNREE